MNYTYSETPLNAVVGRQITTNVKLIIQKIICEPLNFAHDPCVIFLTRGLYIS